MNKETTVHKWRTSSEYYDIENGEKISKQLAKRDYLLIKKWKQIKIEYGTGYIIWVMECRKKNQLSLWGD